MRAMTGIFAILLWFASAVSAQRTEPPATIQLYGGQSLPLAGQARRELLLGDVELYTLGLYLEQPKVDLQRLGSADAPKVLRIHISYEEDVRRRVAIDWRRELVPSLEPAAAAHIDGSFAPLREGDVVIIEYSRTRGTSVRVNSSVAVSGASHDLMLSFLDQWLGQRPVSEEIKNAPLGSGPTP
jgi:hypothetical protein